MPSNKAFDNSETPTAKIAHGKFTDPEIVHTRFDGPFSSFDILSVINFRTVLNIISIY